ncbi:uncharacterized protein LOC108703748 [Xenopus laevis]|uniref:Uncharacterized protein LOC108703748 n=1 Tax=Xenopus laevis TaxID=8355 RepID=A0A8J0U5W8_XENLA|nr:uncharacterized protein LOC108703748 [Xenopus laevis]OCT58981.1 hypothetical protein XELAEV_18001470mg [Xenopus laevis]
MESEKQLQETRGGSDGNSERSEESHKDVRGSSIKYRKYSMLDHRKVPKPLRLEIEVTDTSSEEEIKYLRTDRDTDMRSVVNRYLSLRKCNDLYSATIRCLQSALADAGFYYVGPGDRVRCFSCGGELENWERWDVPLTRHQQSFPDCPYVRGGQRAAVFPINAQYQYLRKESPLFHMSERPSQKVPSSSNCPTVQGQIKDPDYSKVKSITEGESETSAPPSGSSISGQKPLRTMSDENNRLETYRGHRHHFPYNNQRSLSRAGFYYVGPGDRVRCFSCGGELENWEYWDVPLTRHQRSFPDCHKLWGQYQYQHKESQLFHMMERLSPTVPSSSNCPTVQGLIKEPDYSKVKSITEGESEISAPPSGSSISGQKPLGTMRDKHNRLETYRGHRHQFPHNNRQSLSQAGFYYVGPGDRVRCFSCGGELENWEYWDVPLTRHQRSFPDCHKLWGQYQYQHKESQLFHMMERLSPTEVESITEGESEISAPPSGSSISGQKPLWTMSDENNRLETYRGHRHHFPLNNRQSLSRAGFYYVGPGDRVRCFSCAGELENWKDWDDPLTQHQISFPDCPYVLELEAKGLLNLSTELIECMNYMNNPGLSHIKNTGETLSWIFPSSFVTHCDKTKPTELEPGGNLKRRLSLPEFLEETDANETKKAGQRHRNKSFKAKKKKKDQEEGLSGPIKEEASGQVEEGISDQVVVGASGQEKEGASGQVEEGASGQVEEGASGQVKEGASGQVEEGASGQVEEVISDQVEVGASGQVKEWAYGQVKEGASGQVKEWASGQVKEWAYGQVKQGASGQVEVGASGQVKEEDSGQVEEGISQVEVEPRVQKEETRDWPRGSAEECELCGKILEVPRISPQRSGTKYRLVVPGEGLFRCSETGLQFCVESPANIDIEIGSWVEFLGHLHQYTYDIVGPLFNITVKSGQVSAVYLPHYVCLKGGDVDKAMFRVAHYKDDNMILESPNRVEPFYVVLENPTFSPVGVIKLQPSPNGRRRKIPTHGVVMLYSRYKTGYTIHLYLMPHDLSLKQAVHNKETGNCFYWMDKPPRTSTIYTGTQYVVGGPEDAEINPEELELCLDVKSELYNYSEIYLEEIQDKMYLQLTCEVNNTSAWRTRLRTEDLIPKAQVTQDNQHFVDRHRAALIDRMSHIDPVLDDLLGDKILTQEQYDTVRSNRTSQEKMRHLYDCVKTWGKIEKEMFYSTLFVHNRALIKDLLCS